MKRITIFLACLICTVMMLGSEHMKFRTLTIDGDLKTAMKEVKRWGFMGMKIKNVAALVGTLDGEDVMLTLMATPETNTLFSVSIIYEGKDQWSDLLAQYQSINASLAAQYGEPTEVIEKWDAPYSITNNPAQAFKEDKAKYGSEYTTAEGTVVINVIYVDGKLCTMVAYIDAQNAKLYNAQGGGEFSIDEDADVD